MKIHWKTVSYNQNAGMKYRVESRERSVSKTRRRLGRSRGNLSAFLKCNHLYDSSNYILHTQDSTVFRHGSYKGASAEALQRGCQGWKFSANDRTAQRTIRGDTWTRS